MIGITGDIEPAHVHPVSGDLHYVPDAATVDAFKKSRRVVPAPLPGSFVRAIMPPFLSF